MWIIKEEINELEEELKKKDANWNYCSIRKEIIDVTVACIRTLMDIDKLWLETNDV